jgi:hypothetical protein
MRKGLIFFLFLTTYFSNAQNNDLCNDLKEGVFESYEDNKKIGVLYRKGFYQIEKEVNDSTYNIAKIKSKKCLFYVNSYEIKNKLDTITWSVSYRKIKKNHYSFIGKPKYLKVDYKYVGEIKKINDKIIDSQILNIFKRIRKQ